MKWSCGFAALGNEVNKQMRQAHAAFGRCGETTEACPNRQLDVSRKLSNVQTIDEHTFGPIILCQYKGPSAV